MNIAINTTNLVTLTGLYDNLAGTYVNNANVSCNLLDGRGNQIYSFSLAYVAGSNGNYQGTIPYGTVQSLTPFDRYTLDITVDVTNGSNTVQLYLQENAQAVPVQ